MKRIKNEFAIDENWLEDIKKVEFKDAHILQFIRRTKNKEEITDYEAYDLMHKHDGTFTKSDRLSSL